MRSILLKSLLAVLAGNAIYFLLLMPLLPEKARHGIGRLDLGLLIDFWVCLLVYGAVEWIWRLRQRRSRRDQC